MDLNQVLRSNVTFYFDKYLIGEPALDATAPKTGYWASGSLPMPRYLRSSPDQSYLGKDSHCLQSVLVDSHMI